MDNTARLALPFIVAGQALKHITHNEALEKLDALVQPVVETMSLAAPPPSPLDGEAYVVPAGASGAWAGHHDEIAVFQSGAWRFFDPASGWLLFDRASATLRAYSGTQWVALAALGAGLEQFGVNTAADSVNRLAVAAPATLFTHEGAGHQVKINKATTEDTASLLFQSNWSGRAEMGLMGDGDWRIKVSADGLAWTNAITVAASDASISVAGSLRPAADNAVSLGASGARWAAIWAATGTIQTSDRRLKTAIAPTDLGLDFIAALQPVRFRWRDRPATGTFYGLLAEDVADAAQHCGVADFAGYVPGGADTPAALRYDAFIAPLIAAIQTLYARLQALETTAR